MKAGQRAVLLRRSPGGSRVKIPGARKDGLAERIGPLFDLLQIGRILKHRLHLRLRRLQKHAFARCAVAEPQQVRRVELCKRFFCKAAFCQGLPRRFLQCGQRRLAQKLQLAIDLKGVEAVLDVRRGLLR